MSKVEASKATLESINPDVKFEVYSYDITAVDHFDHFLGRLQQGGQQHLLCRPFITAAHVNRVRAGVDDQSPVTLVLSCVDNYQARMTVNQVSRIRSQVHSSALLKIDIGLQ